MLERILTTYAEIFH